MLPFTIGQSENILFSNDDYIVIKRIKEAVVTGAKEITAIHINKQGKKEFKLKLNGLSKEERDIILAGCLINYYRK